MPRFGTVVPLVTARALSAREFTYALENLAGAEAEYQPEPFDIFANYPERELREWLKKVAVLAEQARRMRCTS